MLAPHIICASIVLLFEARFITRENHFNELDYQISREITSRFENQFRCFESPFVRNDYDLHAPST
jgi:hypothetical protein